MTGDVELEDIHDLVPGDVVSVPVENQSTKRQLIVDARPPRRDGTVPLLGEDGGEYHLEQTDELAHLNFYSRSRTDWVNQGTCTIDDVDLNRDL